MWVVMVRKESENYAHVWLTEIRRLKNGAMISTGRNTTKFTYDFRNRALDNIVDRVRQAIAFLVGESLIAIDDEMLLLAGELSEQLYDVLDVDNIDGGDDLE